MARNLRAKIPAEDTLFVQDVNTAASKKFLEENAQGVRIADNVREVAEKAVCAFLYCSLPFMMKPIFSFNTYDLSWGHFGGFYSDYTILANPMIQVIFECGFEMSRY